MKEIVLKSLSSAIVVFLILLVILVLGQIPFWDEINSLAEVLPAKEFYLIRSQDDKIVTILKNNLNGTVAKYSIISVERGDVINMNLSESLNIGGFINFGDTICRLISGETIYQLVRLEGLISNEIATLDFYKSGEKSSIIEEARRRFEYAQQQMEYQKKVLERARVLYEKNLISPQEYETIENTFNLYQANVLIAKAQLEALETGAKPEQIKLIETRIKSLKNELEALKQKAQSYIITSPISGVIFKISAGDTILSIADTSSFCCLIPVNVDRRARIKKGQIVEIKTSKLLRARVSDIENSVRVINLKQMVIVRAVMEGKNEDLVPHLVAKCKIKLERVKLFDYIYSFVKQIF